MYIFILLWKSFLVEWTFIGSKRDTYKYCCYGYKFSIFLSTTIIVEGEKCYVHKKKTNINEHSVFSFPPLSPCWLATNQKKIDITKSTHTSTFAFSLTLSLTCSCSLSFCTIFGKFRKFIYTLTLFKINILKHSG